MEGKGKKADKVIIVLLLIVIVCLVIALYMIGKGLNNVSSSGIVGENKGLLVLDNMRIEEDGHLVNIDLNIKNTSSEVIINKTPVIVYFDKNNMPFHYAWGSRIGYFAPGEERVVRFYDVTEDYDTLKVGYFSRDDNFTYKDLRDNVTFEVEKTTEPDKNGELRLNFKGENTSNEEIIATFQINYYSEGNLIYSDDFMELLDPNSTFETYETYATSFENGTEFPEGYTYDVKLIEAIDNPKEELDDEDFVGVDLHDPSLTDEDRVESAIYKKLKEMYGEDFLSAKIVVDKTYKQKEASKLDELKELKLGENDVAFEVTIDIEPAEDAKVMQFLIPNGEYDEDSGWVHNITRLGVLRLNDDGEYEITDFGTGW